MENEIVDLNTCGLISDMQERKRFFVYGSLVQGMVHHEKFFKNSTFIGNGLVKGSIYRLEVGYHVFAESADGYVPGEIYEVDASHVLIALMDEFHGYSPLNLEKSLYHRKEIEVLVSGVGASKVWAYVANPLKIPKTARKIETGNWKDDFLNNPPLTLRLTDKEKEYVRKLGLSVGRDIVPIQLDIYRQLMNLGLIVDKGRRLALSKLGQEVLRFLE